MSLNVSKDFTKQNGFINLSFLDWFQLSCIYNNWNHNKEQKSMNRSKSSHLLYSPASIENISEEENEQSSLNQYYRNTAFKNELVDTKWIYSMHTKDKQSEIVRLKEIGAFNERYIKGSHKGNGPRFHRNFKQNSKVGTVQNQQNKTGNSWKATKLNSTDNFILTVNQLQVEQQKYVRKKAWSRKNTLKNQPQSPRITAYQQSTCEDQHKEQFSFKQDCSEKYIMLLELKAKKLEKGMNALKQDKKVYSMKMVQYDIQIQKLNQEIFKLKRSESQYQNESSDVSLMIQIQYLQQALNQEVQTKQSLIKERNQLIKQLNQSLQINEQQKNKFNSQLETEKQENERLKEINEQSKYTLNKFNQMLNERQQQIKTLEQRQNELSKQLQQQSERSEELQKQTQKLLIQNKILNKQSEQLEEDLFNVKSQLVRSKQLNNEFQHIIKQKQKSIQQLKQYIQNVTIKLQQSLQECQFVKRIMNNNDKNLKEYQQNIYNKNQEIKKLTLIVATLKNEIYHLAQNNQKQKQQIQLNKASNDKIQQNNENIFIEEICQILKLKPNCENQAILCEIQNLLQSNNHNKQILSDYFQIVELFGVSVMDESCHQKLLTQICQFRNHMTVLLKKIAGFERKIKHLGQQNKILGAKIKQASMKEHQVLQMQNLIRLQNQQIVKYRASMINFSLYQLTTENN